MSRQKIKRRRCLSKISSKKKRDSKTKPEVHFKNKKRQEKSTKEIVALFVGMVRLG